MFDLSFWEITVILIAAVIIVGPERLPGLAYKVGQWVTKVRRFVANAKAEIESEFNTQELRQLLASQEEEMQKLRRLVEQTRHEVELEGRRLTEVLENKEGDLSDARTASGAPSSASQSMPTPPSPRSLDDEIQSLSAELSEQLKRPDFGAGRDEPPPGAAPSSESSKRPA